MPRMNLDKRKILEAAGALANELSVKKLSLNALAARLGIKPPSLYNHVESLDRLRRDLMAYGWETLGDEISDVLIGVSGDEAIRRACNVIYDYAARNPGVFEAMAYYNSDDGEGDSPADRLSAIVYRLCSARDVSEAQAVHVLRVFRSYVEGFALLAKHRSFSRDVPVRESFDLGVEFLIAGIHRLEDAHRAQSENGAGKPPEGSGNYE